MLANIEREVSEKKVQTKRLNVFTLHKPLHVHKQHTLVHMSH
jgi:hypothetical protein